MSNARRFDIEAFKKLNIDDPMVRQSILDEGGFLGFCLLYLPHYFQLEPADFHYDMFDDLDGDEAALQYIGFRGSAKSTIVTTAYALYCALRNIHQFIIIVGDTDTQTAINIRNIRYELEENELIRKDFGTMFEKSQNWSQGQLVLLNKVLIMGRSRGQKVRGLRHRQFRPQLVIVDDPEDIKWVKKKENRDATSTWFDGEVVPAQEKHGSRIVVVINLLHKDALAARLEKKKKKDGSPLFRTRRIPLIDEDGNCTWKGMYPDEAAIQAEKDKVGSATAWSREYLLKIIAEEDQIIKESDISTYPNGLLTNYGNKGEREFTVLDAATGVDLAISEKQTADFTAMVSGYKVNWAFEQDGSKRIRIFILPDPIVERMDIHKTITKAKMINRKMPEGHVFYVEDVAYQKAAIQIMSREGLPTIGVRPIRDKRARLQSASPFIIDGTVMFPETGCEDLIERLVNFGIEEHDDDVDALVYLILKLAEKGAGAIAGVKADAM